MAQSWAHCASNRSQRRGHFAPIHIRRPWPSAGAWRATRLSSFLWQLARNKLLIQDTTELPELLYVPKDHGTKQKLIGKHGWVIEAANVAAGRKRLL